MSHGTNISEVEKVDEQVIVVTHKSRFRWVPYNDKKVISRRGPGRWQTIDMKTGDWVTAELPTEGTYIVED